MADLNQRLNFDPADMADLLVEENREESSPVQNLTRPMVSPARRSEGLSHSKNTAAQSVEVLVETRSHERQERVK